MANSTPTKPALLLTPKQASDALQISPRKLWSLTNSGQIPHVRIGRSIRYRPEDLQDFVDRQVQGGEK